MTWQSGLIAATDAEMAGLSEATCAPVISSDFPGWETELRNPAASPLHHMRAQRQTLNDCRGQSLASGLERRNWHSNRLSPIVQSADMYAYNASEFLSGRLGRNRGASIPAGVTLLVNGISNIGVAPGLPTDEDWPYSHYSTSEQNFIRRAKVADIQDGNLSSHGPLPGWESALVAVAAGGCLDVGMYWPPKWTTVGGHRCVKRAPTGGGGHAVCGIWALDIGGDWYLTFWNSHGDRFFLMGQKVYESLLASRFRPFGGFLLMPQNAQERWSARDWKTKLSVA